VHILVTGATGFIGTYFVDTYSSRYTITPFSFLKDNIETLEFQGVDVVVHLSALVHQMGGASMEAYERINVTQTVALAHKAKNAGVKQFIFMSSVKVYGEESTKAYTEHTQCIPVDAYGKSKLKAEVALQRLNDKHFTVSTIRTPIVYGYGVKANIKNLVSLIKKMPILPFAKIYNRRSMVYIGNLCHLIDVIIQKNIAGVFLSCDGETLSTTELIADIAQALNKKVYLISIPLFEYSLRLFKPTFHARLYGNFEIDNSHTKKLLNLENPYTVQEGIDSMLEEE